MWFLPRVLLERDSENQSRAARPVPQIGCDPNNMVNRLNWPWASRSFAIHQHETAGLPSKEDPPQNAVAPIRYAARFRISDDAGGGDGARDDGGDGVPGPRPTGSDGCCCANDDGTVGPSEHCRPCRYRRSPAASPTVRQPPHSHSTATRLQRPSSPRRQPGSETTCASMYLRTRPRHVSPTRKRYAVDPVALMSDAFRCNSPRCQHRGVAMSLVCSRAVGAGFARSGACGRIESRLVPDVLPQ